jgi:hypothetical protein
LGNLWKVLMGTKALLHVLFSVAILLALLYLPDFLDRRSQRRGKD